MKPEDFSYLQDFLKKQSAILLAPGKDYLVESRLMPLARQEGFATLDAFFAHLKNHPVDRVHRKVIDAMTTNETFFFRDIHPFECLKKTVLPEIIKKRSAEKTLTLWSAACSTGQEAYSIAMLIKEHFPTLMGWKISIVGTDLSESALAKAQEGVYTQTDVNRGLPAFLLVKYFSKKKDNWQISDEIKKMTSFRSINLIQPWPPMLPFDVIFIRNVLIYFDVETKKMILSRLVQHLKKDGALFLGAAESVLNLNNDLEWVSLGQESYFRLKAK